MAESFSLQGVGDVELEASLKSLLKAGARLEAQIIGHLGEVEARGLHLAAGYSSLFQYCLSALGFSEFEAVFRISAARLARKFPLVVELLERRAIHLSALHLLRRFLSEDNHVELLTEACHKSKREVELLLARRYPREDVATSLRKLISLEPLSPGRYRLELTIDEADKQELELACELLSGTEGNADAALVFRRGVRLVVDAAKKRRFGKQSSRRLLAAASVTATPVAPAPVAPEPGAASLSTVAAQLAGPADLAARRPAAAHSGRDHIPRKVTSAVAVRDDFRCTFVAADGRRCGARRYLQIHHEIAWALGGPDTPDNLRLLCAEHNRQLAKEVFGPEQVRAAIQRTRTERRSTAR